MVKKVNLCLVLMVCTVLLLTGLAQAVIISTSGSGIVFDSGGFENETPGTKPSNRVLGTWNLRTDDGVSEQVFGPDSGGPSPHTP